MLFRTVLAKAIAKLPIMTSWHFSVVGESSLVKSHVKESEP
jgi:hypothetical protein